MDIERQAEEAIQQTISMAIVNQHITNQVHEARARNVDLEVENQDLKNTLRCVTCKKVTKRGGELSLVGCGCKICLNCRVKKTVGDSCDGCGHVIKRCEMDTITARVDGKLPPYPIWRASHFS